MGWIGGRHHHLPFLTDLRPVVNGVQVSNVLTASVVPRNQVRDAVGQRLLVAGGQEYHSRDVVLRGS